MANSIQITRGSRGIQLSDLVLSRSESGFWNRSCLEKELVFKRRTNSVWNDIVNNALAEIKETKSCSIEQAGRYLLGIYSTNNVERSVIGKIYNKVIPGLQRLFESKVEVKSFGYMGRELTFLWRLYAGLKYCHGTSFHVKKVYFQPCYLMYLFDRLTVLTAIWRQKDYMFCMKSVLTEWLLSETADSHRKYVGIPYSSLLTNGLTDIHRFMVDLIKYFVLNDTKRASLISHSKEKEVDFVNWLIFSLCFLNLNKQVDDRTVNEMLQSECVLNSLPFRIHGLLTAGFKEGMAFEIKVKNVSAGLQLLGNQLIIIELNEECESTMKVPSAAVLVDYQTWENQDMVFQCLFAEDDEKKKEKEKGISTSKKHKRKMLERDDDFQELRRVSEKLGVMATDFLGGQGSSSSSSSQGVIQWEKMKTEFPLDNVDKLLAKKKGK